MDAVSLRLHRSPCRSHDSDNARCTRESRRLQYSQILYSDQRPELNSERTSKLSMALWRTRRPFRVDRSGLDLRKNLKSLNRTRFRRHKHPHRRLRTISGGAILYNLTDDALSIAILTTPYVTRSSFAAQDEALSVRTL
jgi:hypothetical protein